MEDMVLVDIENERISKVDSKDTVKLAKIEKKYNYAMITTTTILKKIQEKLTDNTIGIIFVGKVPTKESKKKGK